MRKRNSYDEYLDSREANEVNEPAIVIVLVLALFMSFFIYLGILLAVLKLLSLI